MNVYINNLLADYNGDSLKLESNSPFFQNEADEICISLDLPLTSKNVQIFDYPNLLSQENNDKVYDVRIELEHLTKTGTGIITELGENIILSVGLSNSDFFYRIKDKYMSDLVFPVLKSSETMDNGDIPLDNFSYAIEPVTIPPHQEPPSIDSYITLRYQNEKNQGEDDVFLTKNGNLYANHNCNYTFEFSGNINVVAASFLKIYITINRKNNSFQSILLFGKPFDSGYSEDTQTIAFPKQQITLSLEKGDEIRMFFELKPSIKINPIDYSILCFYSFNIHNFHFSYKKDKEVRLHENLPYPKSFFIQAPVYNTTFADGLDSDSEKEKFEINNDFQNFFNPANTEDPFPVLVNTVGNIVGYNYYSLFPYVNYLLDVIAKFAGYEITENALENHADLKDLVLYNNYAFLNFEIGNQCLDIAKTFSIADIFSETDFKISDFLEKLNLFGVGLVCDSQKRTIKILLKNDLFTSQPLTILQKAKISNINFEKYTLCECSFNKIDDTHDVHLFARSKESKDKGELDSYQDLEKVSGMKIGDYYFIKNEGNYYQYEYNGKDDKNTVEWINKGCILAKLTVNPNPDAKHQGKTYKIESDAPLVSRLSNYADGKLFFGGSSQLNARIARVPELKDTKAQFLFSFYRGKQKSFQKVEDGVRTTYDAPLLANDVYDILGEKIEAANTALKFEGKYGIYDKFHQRMFQYLCRAKTVQFEFDFLELSDFYRLRFDGFVRINNHNVLIQSLSYELNDEYVSNVKIKGYVA